jgi:hypothetical protein
VFSLSAQTSIIRDGPNRDYYLKTRTQGLKHVQAVIALAAAASASGGPRDATTGRSPPRHRPRNPLDFAIETPTNGHGGRDHEC